MSKIPEKTKEQILAERQAKKASKHIAKNVADPQKIDPAPKPSTANKPAAAPVAKVEKPVPVVQSEKPQQTEKSKDQVLAEREAKKLAKQAAKGKPQEKGGDKVLKPAEKPQQPKSLEQTSEAKGPVKRISSDVELAVKMEKLKIVDGFGASTESSEKAKSVSKAERRAIQEAQRAAKTKALEEKKTPAKKPIESVKKELKPNTVASVHKTGNVSAAAKTSALHKVKLFKHLYSDKSDLNFNVNNKLHPAIVKLGLQYVSDSVVGSNARCYAFLNAMKIVSSIFI